MKTLVIHPIDETTRFLKKAYQGLEHDTMTIIRSTQPSKSHLRKLIKEHDQVFCFGHGIENGLLGKDRLIIDGNLVQLLRQKEKLALIWCHAADFAKKHQLKNCFATGMFISELGESIDWSVPIESIPQLTLSNEEFALALWWGLQKPTAQEMHQEICEGYGGDEPLWKFNRNRFFYSK